MKKKSIYLLLAVVIAGGIFGLRRWDEYREKDLVDVLEAEAIVAFRYGKEGTADLSEAVNDDQSLEEFTDFLNRYRVKKEGPRDFTSQYPKEQHTFQLEYEDQRISIPILIERDIILIEMDQYRVTNGPIDSEWIEEF